MNRKQCILCDSIYIEYKKQTKLNYTVRNQDSGYPWEVVMGDAQWLDKSMGGFKGAMAESV